jgi:hypothetical protein
VSPWRDLPLWILFPLGYGAASVARAVAFPTVGDRYPYFFLDPTSQGYGWVAGQFVRLGLIFAVLGAVLLAYDRLAARVTTRSGRKPAITPAPATVVAAPATAVAVPVMAAPATVVAGPAPVAAALGEAVLAQPDLERPGSPRAAHATTEPAQSGPGGARPA